MSQRMWEKARRPDWSKAQAERLEEGHAEQMRSHEEWLKQEKERKSSSTQKNGIFGLGLGLSSLDLGQWRF